MERGPLQRSRGPCDGLCAGTSDWPLGEEAAVTAEIMGNRVERIADVGVAGIHRLFAHLETVQRANVVIVVAGMERALPSGLSGRGWGARYAVATRPRGGCTPRRARGRTAAPEHSRHDAR